MTSEPPVTFWLNKGPAAADERLAASTTAIAVPNVMLFMARILRSKAKLDCSISRRRNAPQQALFSDGRDPAVRAAACNLWQYRGQQTVQTAIRQNPAGGRVAENNEISQERYWGYQ